MFKLIAFFALLAAAFAAPKPDPLSLTYSAAAGIPLSYSGAIGAPISYSPVGSLGSLGYNYAPYASGYYYGGSPYAYRNLYI